MIALWPSIIMVSAIFGAPQDAPETVIRSIVVVGDDLERDDIGPAAESGITLDPVVETDAERSRKDAERALATQQLPNLLAQKPPEITIVSVDQVAVSRPNVKNAEACVQIGVVNARRDCRPDKTP